MLIKMEDLDVFDLDPEINEFLAYDDETESHIRIYYIENEKQYYSVYIASDHPDNINVTDKLFDQYIPVSNKNNRLELWLDNIPPRLRTYYLDLINGDSVDAIESDLEIMHFGKTPMGFYAELHAYIDFQDIYMILIKYLDWIYCPLDYTGRPLYYTNGGRFRPQLKDKILKGYGDDIEVVCNYNGLTVMGNSATSEKIKNDVLLDLYSKPSRVQDIYLVELLLETKNNLDLATIYAAGLLDLEVFKCFFVNETTRIITDVNNRIVEYGSRGIHVKINRYMVNPSVSSIKIKKKLWKVSVLLREKEIDTFISDIKYMVAIIENNPDDISIIVDALDLKEKPECYKNLGKYHTGKYTINTSKHSIQRPRSIDRTGNIKAIIFPPDRLEDAIRFAEEWHKTPAPIYVGINDNNPRLELLDGNPDNVLAYYVSYNRDYPELVNEAINNRGILPRVDNRKSIKDNYEEYDIEGMNMTVEYSRTAILNITDTLHLDIRKYDNIDYYKLCRKQCFDMAYEEYLESLQTLDTRLHIAGMEEDIDANIYVLILRSIERKICKVNIEIPRHSNIHIPLPKRDNVIVLLRDGDRYFKVSGDILKFVDNFEKYYEFVNFTTNEIVNIDRQENDEFDAHGHKSMIYTPVEVDMNFDIVLALMTQIYQELCIALDINIAEIKDITKFTDKIYLPERTNWHIDILKNNMSNLEIMNFYFPEGIYVIDKKAFWAKMTDYFRHRWPMKNKLHMLHYKNPKISNLTYHNNGASCSSYEETERYNNILRVKKCKYDWHPIIELPRDTNSEDLIGRTRFSIRISNNNLAYCVSYDSFEFNSMNDIIRASKEGGWDHEQKLYSGLESLTGSIFTRRTILKLCLSKVENGSASHLVYVYCNN